MKWLTLRRKSRRTRSSFDCLKLALLNFYRQKKQQQLLRQSESLKELLSLTKSRKSGSPRRKMDLNAWLRRTRTGFKKSSLIKQERNSWSTKSKRHRRHSLPCLRWAINWARMILKHLHSLSNRLSNSKMKSLTSKKRSLRKLWSSQKLPRIQKRFSLPLQNSRRLKQRRKLKRPSRQLRRKQGSKKLSRRK